MLRFPRIDDLIAGFDQALRTLAATPVSERPHPDARLAESELSEEEKRHAAGLMRVNHCGEVCAQALYLGALFLHLPLVGANAFGDQALLVEIGFARLKEVLPGAYFLFKAGEALLALGFLLQFGFYL